MSFGAPRAMKRLRLATKHRLTTQTSLTTSTRSWTYSQCRRGLSATAAGQQQQQEQWRSPMTGSNAQEKTTHFGFETVAESQKEQRVASVFSSVASSYDAMNDFMSLGIHRLWKDHFVQSLNPGVPDAVVSPVSTAASSTSAPASGAAPQGQRILDIAGGSGDIALRMLEHATRVHRDHATHVTISDINPQMLAEGRKRLSATPYHAAGRVNYLEANAEDLTGLVEDNSIDLYTVAFGIRNFTHKERALREAYRVLKPGGTFACLEFAPRLSNGLLNAIYKRWSFSAIPLIGQVVAADRDSYQYLVESIERFPSQPEWAAMIADAGFLIPGDVGRESASRRVPGWESALVNGFGSSNPMRHGWEDLSMGIAAIHKGVKPAA